MPQAHKDGQINAKVEKVIQENSNLGNCPPFLVRHFMDEFACTYTMPCMKLVPE